MAITTPRSTKRSDAANKTKDKLFKTALKLFSKYGYSSVTIEDITNTAGLSKGSFYVHFKSKDAILLDVFHQIDSSYEEAFQDISESMSCRDRILLLINTMMKYCNRTVGIEFMKVVYINQISNNDHSLPILNDKTRTLYKLMEEAVRIGKKTNELPRTPSIEYFTELFVRFARSVIYDWCLYNGSFDLEEEAQKFFKLMLDSFRSRAAS
ncbi:MAG: TetR/AcrR family transcriptional regulator [Eubacterium sp.]|nr:TetR/AcrR family transcriptional regulator [Eubacterium sp.]